MLVTAILETLKNQTLNRYPRTFRFQVDLAMLFFISVPLCRCHVSTDMLVIHSQSLSRICEDSAGVYRPLSPRLSLSSCSLFSAAILNNLARVLKYV